MKETMLHFSVCVLLALVATSCATADTMSTSDSPPTAAQNVQPVASANAPSEKWSERAQEVLMNALSLSGIRYRYGGNSPDTGFDCSGFVRYVFKQATSLTLPRSAMEMSQLGKTVAKKELKPGDLVFFNTLKSAFSHVGIYIGNNRFIHSPREGGVVRVERLDTTYWAKRYDGAQRLDTDQELSNTNN